MCEVDGFEYMMFFFFFFFSFKVCDFVSWFSKIANEWHRIRFFLSIHFHVLFYLFAI